jgi:hypothetical protein
MLISTEEINKEKLRKRNPAIAAGSNNNNNNISKEQVDNSKGEFGIQGDFNNGAEGAMSKSS